MIIGVPGEMRADENRVALTPGVAEELLDQGHEVLLVSGAGDDSDFGDEAYDAVGCELVSDREAVFERAEIILQVESVSESDLDAYREDQVVIGLFDPYNITDETCEKLAEREISAFALELIPRISRAQSMDVLSSMASLGGYQACLLAATELPKMFPLEMTAAGTIQPADVFVIGAGVAGLKAISTAERLGASVRAYDIRLEVKREVQSLGADFVELDLETDDSGDEEGYAREMDEEFYRQQRKELTRVVGDSDVVITTAAIPGAPAPELVTSEMIEEMDEGSVIVDLSAESGGNCEPTQAGETIEYEGVTIHGPTDLVSSIAHTASEQFASNLSDFLDNLLEDGSLDIDLEDEIVDSTLLTHDGEIRNPHREEESEETAESNEEQEESEGTDPTAETENGDDGETEVSS
jgi:NAD(P) transhydrogenase subunit alpha